MPLVVGTRTLLAAVALTAAACSGGDISTEPARWLVDETPAPDATSFVIVVEDIHHECGHDPNFRVIPPEVSYGETEIELTVQLVAIDPEGGYTCEGFGPTLYTIVLDQPVGQRTIAGDGQVEKLENPLGLEPSQHP